MDNEKRNDEIDLDAIEDLPDVVLGEKTRAMRVIRDAKLIADHGNTEETTTLDVPVEEKEENPVIEEPIAEEIVLEDEPKETPKEDSAKDTNQVEIVLDDEPQQDVTEEEDEIPTSVTDDDPGVNDELSEVYEEQNKHDITDPLPKASDDLSNVYAQQDAKKPEYFEETQVVDSNDNNPPKPKKRRKRHNIVARLVTVLLVLLIALLGFSIYNLYDSIQPVQKDSEEVLVQVHDGDTVKTVAQNLQEQGIIKNAQTAYYYIKYKKLTDIKAGIFTIDKSWTLDELFTTLNDDSAATRNATIVTIIEGDWAKDIAKKMSAVTNVSADDLLNLWNNRDWITSQMDTYPFLTEEMFKDNVRVYLEGYLAPDTYQVHTETTAEEITKMLLDQSLKIYNNFASDIASSGHSIADIYTMASIIQYEAGSDMESLKNVAGVFYNRLNQGMMLQSSVTVCYAIDFDKETDNWQACEVNPNFDNPYNTYMYNGLTPGPIENAGVNALEAAIHPNQHNYLYFMADVYGDGTIYYAETLEEHNANVAKYLH